MVTHNYCRKKIKKYYGKKNLFVSLTPQQYNDMIVYDSTEQIFEPTFKSDLFNHINKLSFQQKKCIQLFYLENKSYKRVSQLTGYTLKQVKSYLQNGRRLLRKRLEYNT
ncbi:MAG: sigma-70 family RNA polymerase sigma factor [Calditrichaeota bacterium]|nr:MAG: sigma-70 family RNA polymerase sigma factor [Calditrichota bacterium]